MSEEEIEKVIKEEFGDVLAITDEEISELSFAESCAYVETLNKIEDRIEELKHSTKEV